MGLSGPEPQPTAAFSSANAQDINGKIAQMLEATAALKGSSSHGTLLQGPLVPAKKRRLKDNKVLVRMKTVINDRLNSRSAKKAYDSARDDCLLDNSISDSPEQEATRAMLGTTSTVEIRLNEGML
jgi:hypothetical protein